MWKAIEHFVKAEGAKALASFPLHWPAMLALALTRKPSQPWVIGGHRGRAYEDNAAGLHRYLRSIGQPVVWIANPGPLLERLTSEGVTVLARGSWRARKAIAKAPVLVYSHGEDDLDPLMRCYRGASGLRVHLNHCINVLKAGNAWTPAYHAASPLGRWLRRQVMIDFDLLPALSPLEASYFQMAFPHLHSRILDHGGGAHLDAWAQLLSLPQGKHLYWFPTFRDDAEGQAGLFAMIEAVTQSASIKAYLEAHHLTLYIGAHLNTPARPLHLEAPFELRPMHSLVEDIVTAQLFISDYSGLMACQLICDAPALGFLFDEAHYRQNRFLFTEPSELVCGPICRDLASLERTLTSDSWRHDEAAQARRQSWRKRLNLVAEPIYAQRTYEAIRARLVRF